MQSAWVGSSRREDAQPDEGSSRVHLAAPPSIVAQTELNRQARLTAERKAARARNWGQTRSSPVVVKPEHQVHPPHPSAKRFKYDDRPARPLSPELPRRAGPNRRATSPLRANDVRSALLPPKEEFRAPVAGPSRVSSNRFPPLPPQSAAHYTARRLPPPPPASKRQAPPKAAPATMSAKSKGKQRAMDAPAADAPSKAAPARMSAKSKGKQRAMDAPAAEASKRREEATPVINLRHLPDDDVQGYVERFLRSAGITSLCVQLTLLRRGYMH